MIRYEINPPADLDQLIDAESAKWRERATTRTASLVTAGRYAEASSIWGEVKAVFMRLQKYKCAFCERRLATEHDGGGVEWDLEHFRPKSSVSLPDSKHKIRFPVGTESSSGYYWLAYEPQNYCACCKQCNSPLKSDHFPIAGPRGAVGTDLDSLNKSEKPYFVYPIGTLDTNPREIITYLGEKAVPVFRRGHKHRRAKITIQLLGLNREQLLRERAEVLRELGGHIRILGGQSARAKQEQAMEDIRQMLLSSSRYSACVQAMIDLYRNTPTRALALMEAARQWLRSFV